MVFLRCCSLNLMLFLLMLQFLRVNCENENKGDLDDVIVDFINATYIDEDTFDLSVNYNDGGNSLTIKVDVINELPSPIYWSMKVFGRALGQYKVPTGISMDIDICDGKVMKYFLESTLKSLGVDISQCPPKPGSYGIEDYKGNIDGLPIYGLPGLSISIETELHSPPDISILKLKAYRHVR